MDDPFVFCPYDRKHRVPRSRIQAHIVRCEEKYPPLAICPYNATHRLPHEQIMLHVQDCESRLSMFPDEKPPKVVAALTTPNPTLQKEYITENEPDNELWDD